MTKSTKAFFSLLLAAFIYGSFGVYIRLLNHELAVYQQILFRGLTGLLFAVIFILLTKTKVKFFNISRLSLAIFMLSFPFTIIVFSWSILLTKINTTIFGLYTGSLISSLIIGNLFFKEKITPIKKIVLALSFVGLFIYSYPLSANTLNLGMLLALLSGVGDTITQSSRKYLGGKVDRLVLVALQMVGIIGAGLVCCLIAGQLFLPVLSISSWIIGLWFGLMLVGITYFTIYGFQHFDLNLGTIIISSELFFGSLFGLMFFREIPKIQEILGSIVILLAIVLLNTDFKKFLARR